MRVADWVLVGTLAFAWYHVGIIWLVQVVVWPLFAYVGRDAFPAYHEAWWRGIRYVVFVPSGLAVLGALLLLWFTPPGVPRWLAWTGVGIQGAVYGLTAVWWGPGQARLTTTDSPLFATLIKTHWVRTALVSGFGLALLAALVLRVARG